jgi:hypothetical protein
MANESRWLLRGAGEFRWLMTAFDWFEAGERYAEDPLYAEIWYVGELASYRIIPTNAAPETLAVLEAEPLMRKAEHADSRRNQPEEPKSGEDRAGSLADAHLELTLYGAVRRRTGFRRPARPTSDAGEGSAEREERQDVAP